MNYKQLTFVLLLLLLYNCSLCDDNTNDCTNIACTEQFVMITVSIVDQEQNPFILDDYKVTDLDNNIDLTNELKEYYKLYMDDGVYPIFDDRFQQTYQNQEIDLQFIGYVDGQEILNEIYSVGADCCHVYLISGDYEIIVE